MKREKVLRTLIVEDDRTIAKNMKYFILNTFNRQIQVLIAKNFEEAKAIIEKGMINIFIIDFGLPDGDGEDLIDLIRELYPKAPIIAQTTIEDKDFQLRIYRKFKGITYITKHVLFEELQDAVAVAKKEALCYETKRVPLISRGKIESIDLDMICHITTIPNTGNLNIEYYDHEKGDYNFKTMNGTTLGQFLKKYNDSGYFLRCHASYIINKKMVKKVNKLDNYILLLYKRSNGSEVRIDVSEGFKKEVLTELKGFY